MKRLSSCRRALNGSALIAVAATAGTASSGAWAQEQPPTTAAAPAADAAAQDAAAQGEIIVTANKRQQSITDVGMTITAQTGETLLTRGINSPLDLGKAVPGLTVQPSPLSSPVYTLRGVGFYEATLSAAPTVAVYVDEVVVPFSAETRGVAFDVERVEVLKGPQGTLFGANTTGGAINYIANKPTDTLSAGFDGTFGRFATFDGTAFISGPVSDTLKVRLAGRLLRGGSWQYNYNRDDKIGRQRQIDGRFIAEWTPSERLNVIVTATGWKDTGDTQQAQYLTDSCRGSTAATCALDNPFQTNFRTFPSPPKSVRAADWAPTIFGKRPRRDDWFYQLSLRGDYQLTDEVVLTSISAYSKFSTSSRQDFDGTPFRATDIHSTGDIKTISQELRLTGTMERINWIVGGNYERSKTFDDTLYAIDEQATNVFYAVGGPFALASEAYAFQTIRSLAAFANVEYELNDALTAVAGIRYTETKRKFRGCSVDPGNNEFSPFWNAIFGIDLGPGDCFVFTENFPETFRDDEIIDQLKEDNISWNVGLNYKTPGDSLIYARVSKGYKAGSFPNLQAASVSQYAPVAQESLLAYEVGAKLPLLDRTVTLSGALFYYDYKNKQLKGRAPDPVFRDLDALVQVPKSNVKGAEIELNARPIEGLSLFAGATYIKTKIKDYTAIITFGGSPVDFTGQAFPYSPKWTVVADAQYDFPITTDLNIFFGGSITYNSSTSAVLRNRNTSTIAADHLFDIDSYALIDVRAGLESPDKNWKVYAYGRNITNKYYWTNVLDNVSTIVRYTGQPATYGVGVSYRF